MHKSEMLSAQQKWILTAKTLGLAALVLSFMGAIFLPVQQALDSLPL